MNKPYVIRALVASKSIIPGRTTYITKDLVGVHFLLSPDEPKRFASENDAISHWTHWVANGIDGNVSVLTERLIKVWIENVETGEISINFDLSKMGVSHYGNKALQSQAQ